MKLTFEMMVPKSRIAKAPVEIETTQHNHLGKHVRCEVKSAKWKREMEKAEICV